MALALSFAQVFNILAQNIIHGTKILINTEISMKDFPTGPGGELGSEANEVVYRLY